ncbi:MAG: lipoyl(octanoyl) transferase LipB [Flavobacteriales bacterium AspAUS03]
MIKNKTILFEDLGCRDYLEVWNYQQERFMKIVDLKLLNRKLPKTDQRPTSNHLLFVEHPHVYTLGRSGKYVHLLLSEELLGEIGATFYQVNRGGDITYHGPGQVVGYPILDLDHFFTDMHKYLRLLEEVVIRTLSVYGLDGDRSAGETGVWLDVGKPYTRKICAIGVHASRWVTMHGFALNVNIDLQYFEYIIPCGIRDKAVTSLAQELHYEVSIEEVKERLKINFQEVFGVVLLESSSKMARIFS